ncbi:F-box/LRR-repeat protein 13 [Cricetulus griseus]|uniref:F-box/LRR-repeat protein 13 n=1 Tax=Cricetulus griseus TaxID=10029 RepID=A0A061IQM0_CRIGR|nr:F-box/LRR-repeat protein 13 [Cricetulus griseus]
MIITIIQSGLENLLWDMCIDPSLKPKIRRLSETYLEQLFGLDDQLVTPELMIKACTFYTGHLIKSHFGGWREVAIPRINQEAIMAEKMNKAIAHCKFKCQKLVFNHWLSYVESHKERLLASLFRLRQIFSIQRQKVILAKWKENARRKCKRREENLILNHELQLRNWKSKATDEKSLGPEQSYSEAVVTKPVEFDISALPQEAITQIFSYLTFRDTIRCGKVNHSWMAMTQSGFLWNAIDFSTVKNIEDKFVVTTLQKWRLNVLRLNFRGCFFRTKTLKAVRPLCSPGSPGTCCKHQIGLKLKESQVRLGYGFSCDVLDLFDSYNPSSLSSSGFPAFCPMFAFEGYLDCFQVLAIMNNVAMSTDFLHYFITYTRKDAAASDLARAPEGHERPCLLASFDGRLTMLLWIE